MSIYRRITALLCCEGWKVNHKRVEELWRKSGLKVTQRRKKRGWISLNGGYCVRYGAEHPDCAWSYDFVGDHTSAGKKVRFRTVIDGYGHESLAVVSPVASSKRAVY